MWVCCHLQFIYRQVLPTCNNWQVISALADADKFGGCRFQWIWRRESPFRRRVASKVFPGGYGSVTCVGVCFLRCKLKIPCLWWLACGLLWIRDTVQAEISNLHGVFPDVAPCNLKLFKTYVQKGLLFFPTATGGRPLFCALSTSYGLGENTLLDPFHFLMKSPGNVSQFWNPTDWRVLESTTHVKIVQFRGHISTVLAGPWPDSKLVPFVAS